MWYLPILVLKHFYESQKQFLWFPIEITTIKKRYGSMHLLKIPKIHLITPNQLTKHRKILSPIRFKLSSPIINICHVPRGEISQSERKKKHNRAVLANQVSCYIELYENNMFFNSFRFTMEKISCQGNPQFSFLRTIIINLSYLLHKIHFTMYKSMLLDVFNNLNNILLFVLPKTLPNIPK